MLGQRRRGQCLVFAAICHLCLASASVLRNRITLYPEVTSSVTTISEKQTHQASHCESPQRHAQSRVITALIRKYVAICKYIHNLWHTLVDFQLTVTKDIILNV